MVTHSLVVCWDRVWCVDGMVLCNKKMADLPDDRVTPEKHPFCNTRVDYFGPILGKRGRSTMKRYGTLFTCLFSRAVHLEMSASLDTDAFINVLRGFIARRGQVQMIRSDDSTNLVGAERELCDARRNEMRAKLSPSSFWKWSPGNSMRQGHHIMVALGTPHQIYMTGHVGLGEGTDIEWRWSSHFVCWGWIHFNSRTLTRSSTHPNDLTCLTPNRLLLLKDQCCLPLGIFTERDNHVLRRWRQIQYLSDLFWKRWTREYLPLLIERQKWLFPSRNVQVAMLSQWWTPVLHVVPGCLVGYGNCYDFIMNMSLRTKSSTLVCPDVTRSFYSDVTGLWDQLGASM